MKRTNLVALITAFIVLAGMTGALYFHSHRKEENTALKRGTKDKAAEWVILLHGISRSPRSMNKIQKALEHEGYRVLNFGYPSRKESIETIAALLDRQVRELPEGRGKVHFVTHSLGAIIVRYYLAHYRIKKPGRIVMIAPPNRGSTLAALLKKWQPYKWYFGQAGQEVAGSPDSLPRMLPAPKMEFGVIAGGTGKKLGINPIMPGDNDGTVQVEETRLEGMKDFIVIGGQHSTLLVQPRVIRNLTVFLENGAFIHEAADRQSAGP